MHFRTPVHGGEALAIKRPGQVPGLAVAVGIAFAGLGSVGLNAQEQPLRRTDLLREALGVAEGKDVVAYVVDAAPGAVAGQHRHPGDEFLYVLEGAVTAEVEGRSPVTLQAGEILHEPYGVPHGARNASATEPARVLVFMVVEQGKPLAEPVR